MFGFLQKGAVSFRFFSETASAEGLVSSVPRFFFLDLNFYSGAFSLPSLTQLPCQGPSYPTLASPFTSLEIISILNHITSLIFFIHLDTFFLSSVFLFRVELFLHGLAPASCFCFLRSIILSSSPFLPFSSNPVPIRTGSPNITTVLHSSSLKPSTSTLFSTLWLNSSRKLRDASSSNVLMIMSLLPSKVLSSLASSARNTLPMLDGSLVSGSSRFFRGDS